MVAENFVQGPYFGDFGGRFVAESLMGPLEEVEAAWKRLWRDRSFQRRLRDLFVNYPVSQPIWVACAYSSSARISTTRGRTRLTTFSARHC